MWGNTRLSLRHAVIEDVLTRSMTEGIAEAIERHLAAWPGVTVEERAAGFVEFKVGRRELGHLHGNRLADLPFPVRIREQLVAAGKASVHYVHPETGWVSFYIQGEQDLEAVIELFRLNYARPWLREGTSPLA